MQLEQRRPYAERRRRHQRQPQKNQHALHVPAQAAAEEQPQTAQPRAAEQQLIGGNGHGVAALGRLFRDDIAPRRKDGGAENQCVSGKGLRRKAAASVHHEHPAEAEHAACDLPRREAVGAEEQRRGEHGQKRRAGGDDGGIRACGEADADIGKQVLSQRLEAAEQQHGRKAVPPQRHEPPLLRAEKAEHHQSRKREAQPGKEQRGADVALRHSERTVAELDKGERRAPQ